MRTFEKIKRKIIGNPISLTLAKNQMNIEDTFTEDDTLITQYIAAAEGRCSGLISQAIFKTEITHTINNYLGGLLVVRENPLNTFTSISIFDEDDNEIVLADDDYIIYDDTTSFVIELKDDNPLDKKKKIVLEYTTGREDDEVEPEIVQAILIEITTLYDNERSDYTDYRNKNNRAVYNLLSKHIIDI